MIKLINSSKIYDKNVIAPAKTEIITFCACDFILSSFNALAT